MKPRDRDSDLDLRALFADVESVHSDRAARRGSTLRFECGDDVPPIVRGDREKLRQVLTNLLTNSLEFADRGIVSIDARWRDIDGGRLSLEIRDPGPGLSEDQQRRAFEPFTKFHPGRGGPGLGLAITKRLVDVMRGKIDLVSGAGCGTTFYVQLPAPHTRPTKSATERSPRRESSRGGASAPARDEEEHPQKGG